MKRIIFPLLALLSLLIFGCGDDDNGNGPPPVEKPPRLVVDTSVVAPNLTAVDEAVWFQVDSVEIVVGKSETYGQNPALGERSVWMKAIKKDSTLYIWAKWRDANANTYADYMRTINEFNNWERVVDYGGQDVFAILFDFRDNGDEKADCASMCHEDGTMKTTGGGRADMWKWMSTSTGPAMMAEDQNMDAGGTDADATINKFPYRKNIHFALPDYMHPDTTEFNGMYLFLDEAVDYDNNITWPFPFSLPGYVIDSTIFSDPARTDNSMNDVRAISHYDSTGLETSDYTWTVVYERALTTTHPDDVNLAGLDSIMVTIAATHGALLEQHVNHSGSEPFYIILNPEFR